MERKEQKQGMGGFFQTILGRIVLMGGVALAASIILGYVGMAALNKNSRNNEVLTDINRINLYQYENQSLDTSYLYFLEDTYLENIVSNLGEMDNLADAAAGHSRGGIRSDISSMADTLQACKSNYEEIRELSSERGFTEETGQYADFLAQDEEIGSIFTQIQDDQSWVDTTWREIAGGARAVTIGGKRYYKYTYRSAVPDIGKRESLYVRIGATGAEYRGDLMINNITLHKGGSSKKVDLSAFDLDSLSGSYGSAMQDMKLAKLGGKDSIRLKSRFTAANGIWEEVSVKFPMSDYNMQDYNSVSYDLYLSAGRGDILTTAFAFADKYDFNGTLAQINSEFADYSRHVVEGNDVAQEAASIQSMFDETVSNLEVCVVDQKVKKNILKKVNAKQEVFAGMTEKDSDVLERKTENIALSAQLTQYTDEVRESIDRNTSAAKKQLFAVILLVLVIGAAVIGAITVYLGRSMNRSVVQFRDTLSGMMQGDLTVRADEMGRDEFSLFGKYVNEFLGKISGVIQAAQDISEKVKISGSALDEMAEGSNTTSTEISQAVEDISSGAETQAEEVETASMQIADMGEAFQSIVSNVGYLDDVTDKMKKVSDESVVFMDELSDANQKTSEAFSQVVHQIHATNESVNKIREATELITSIASQTNLLSLNASIEAARAGEAGKGFAVVATEISQLAAQSSSSAEIIKGIIDELVQEAQLTVSIVDDVSEIIGKQKDKLHQTSSHFHSLERGIESSDHEMNQIRESASVCETARSSVNEIVISLSAISQENAASAEETTASMLELNEMISRLVTTSKELIGFAEALDGNLRFFRI